MKKILHILNTKTTRSIIVGLVLAMGIMAASSAVQALSVRPFIGKATDNIHRNGSLTIGDIAPASWILQGINPGISGASNPDCVLAENEGSETCLDVSGGAVFINSLIERSAFLIGKTVVGGNLSSGQTTSFPGNDPARFIIQDTGANSGILASGLGFRNGVGVFSPRDDTTQQQICATADGTLFRCVGVPTPPPVTYDWLISDWGSCSSASAASCTGSWTTTSTLGGSCNGSWTTTTTTPGPGQCTYDWENEGCDDIGGGQWGNCQSANGTGTINATSLSDCLNQIENFCGNGANTFNNGSTASCDITASGNGFYTYEESNFVSFVPGTGSTSTTNTNQCSGPTTASACTSQNSACSFTPNTTTTTNQCAGPTTASACTSQNSACSFTPAGVSTKQRTVTCQDSLGNNHPDQVCIDNGAGTKPPLSSTEGCSGVTPIIGSCGSANGGTSGNPPTSGLCTSGTATNVTTNTNSYTWSCNGSNGGANDSCTSARIVLPAPINGSCGSANGTLYLEEPQPNTRCASGTPTGTSSYGPWTWSCNGSNGGINVSCSTTPNNWQLVLFDSAVSESVANNYTDAGTAYAGDLCPDISPSGIGRIYSQVHTGYEFTIGGMGHVGGYDLLRCE